uniref:de novo designed protein n=1 Tax=synthetic construct TaxID=32630 RepID=UPI00202BBAD9|nr:Chain A, de novo designed protein [synthetic construct]
AKARDKLEENRDLIVERLKVDEIADFMIEKGELTEEEKKKVDAEDSERKRAEKLVEIVMKMDDAAVKAFYDALKAKGYSDLASLLESGLC